MNDKINKTISHWGEPLEQSDAAQESLGAKDHMKCLEQGNAPLPSDADIPWYLHTLTREELITEYQYMKDFLRMLGRKDIRRFVINIGRLK